MLTLAVAPLRWADVTRGRRIEITRPSLGWPGSQPDTRPLMVTVFLRVSPLGDTSWWETTWGEQIEHPALPSLDECGEPIRLDANREEIACSDLVAPGSDRCPMHGGRGR